MNGAQKTILVADDKLSMRQLLSGLLESWGYVVIAAADGHELLEQHRRLAETGRSADLVLTDLQMPRIGGLGVIRSIRGRDPHVPIVLMSAFCSSETRHEARALGVTGIMQKPFELEELFRTIHALVERGTKREQLEAECR